MVIYKETLIYIGLGLVVLIFLGIVAIKQIQKSPSSNESSQKEVLTEKPPTDDTMDGFNSPALSKCRKYIVGAHYAYRYKL